MPRRSARNANKSKGADAADAGADGSSDSGKKNRGSKAGGRKKKASTSGGGARKKNDAHHHTLRECLGTLEIKLGSDNAARIDNADSLDDAFKVVKRAYHKLALMHHPDKGGDAAKFRSIQVSFEVLRDLYTGGKIESFSVGGAATAADASNYDRVYEHFATTTEVPSWDFFNQAAQEEVPGYRVEPARSGRSRCARCNGSRNPRKEEEEDSTHVTLSPLIGKGEIRIGSLDNYSGSYGRWHHLPCWQVPTRVWMGLPQDLTDADAVKVSLQRMEEVLLTGFCDLDDEQQAIFVEHVVDKGHWARETHRTNKRKPASTKASAAENEPAKKQSKPSTKASAAEKEPTKKKSKPSTKASAAEKEPTKKKSKPTKKAAPTAAAAAGTALLAAKPPREKSTALVAPHPNKVAVVPRNRLEGKTFVLTGVFPQVGGGAGLNLGKDRTRAIIEKFGGRVTSAVSGKTDYLVVGEEPGASKVSKAKERAIPLITLKAIMQGLKGKIATLEDAKPPVITSFSAGYQGRSRIGYY